MNPLMIIVITVHFIIGLAYAQYSYHRMGGIDSMGDGISLIMIFIAWPIPMFFEVYSHSDCVI